MDHNNGVETKDKKKYSVGDIVKFTNESEQYTQRHGEIVTIIPENKFIVKII